MTPEWPAATQLPWQVTEDEFLRSAASIPAGGACCVFVIDDTIPRSAHQGYVALVIAYAREDEPVCLLEGGAAAVLVRDGGIAAARVVAARLIDQVRRLGLERTVRAGVAELGGEPAGAIQAARAAAAGAEPGTVGAA